MGKRKTIVCLETGKQFNSVENAANAIGVSSGFISRQIKAGKPIKGFYYYYAGEMLPDEYRQKIRNQKKKPNKNSRPVICLETGERFESLTLASRMLGTRKSNVFNAIKNGSTAHGFHFYYGDEYNPFVRHAPVKTTEAVFRFFANGYRREHGTEPEVTGNRKLSERDILSGMRQMLYDLSNE